MTKNTAAVTAPKTTVRMFDGAAWAEYKIGSKKHKAAEARRAEWSAARPTAEDKAKRATANKAQAAWMREQGVTPTGSAWKLVNEGERNVKVLKAANAADGIAAPKAATAKAPADRKAKATKAAKVVTEVVETEVVSPKKAAKAARKARSAAAAKGWETRRANAAAKAAEAAEAEVVVYGKPESAERKAGRKARKAARVAAVAVEVDPFETFAAPLFAVGLDSEQVARAWSIVQAKAAAKS